MSIRYIRAGIGDIELLCDTRITVLRAANRLPEETDMSAVRAQTRDYYARAIAEGDHAAYLAMDGSRVVAAGGVSFFQVMPTYHNPSGWKAYIMNMYTDPAYRRRGIAHGMLDMLVAECRSRNISAIALEATDMGRPLYEKYGFVTMQHEMELPQ